ncbi:gluconate 2-dehydrogenase subunit 3 family protein [Parahaliea aestuarii]
MNRREFLQAAALLAAGATAVPRGWTMSTAQQNFLAAQPDYIDRHSVDFFTPLQRSTISAMAGQVIPATDTPGALDAGVPRFIELMVADWFNEEERRSFMDGLDTFVAAADGEFAALPEAQQLALLEQAEEEASESGWYAIGGTMRMWDATAPFICQLKELTVLGFFLSDVGATQVLRENPMGSFSGDIPLASDDAAYNAIIPMRVMFEGRTDAF